MKIMRLALIGFSALVFCGVSSADTLTASYTFNSTITNQTTDFLNSTLGVTKFDPSLGTLVDVSLNYTTSYSTTLTVSNNSASPSSGTDKMELYVLVDDQPLTACPACVPAVPTASGNFAGYVPELDLLSPSQSYSLTSGQSVILPTKTGSGSATVDINHTLAPSVYAAIFAELSGTGTFNLSAGTFTQTLLGNTGGNTASSQSTTATISGNVVYTYVTAAPEPTTLFLMGTALVGLGLIRKRVKS